MEPSNPTARSNDDTRGRHIFQTYLNKRAFKFPEDIERLIFEQAAWQEPNDALQLVLVAKRVQHWIERFIYEVVPHTKVFAFLRAFEDNPKPAHFYAKYIKGLCIQYSDGITFHTVNPKAVFDVLSSCKSLDNLAHWISWRCPNDDGPTMQKRVEALDLRPRRFSGQLLEYFCNLPNSSSDPLLNFNLPFFSRLTHLDINDSPAAWHHWTGLATLPNLTHLAFFSSVDDSVDTSDIRTFIDEVLDGCQTLQVVMFASTITLIFDKIFSEDRDPRCVKMNAVDKFHSDWSRLFGGEDDLWTVAEEMVKQQRAALETTSNSLH